MVGRGDKNSVDELNQAVTGLNFLLAQWRLRGVDLFDVQDATLPVPSSVIVSNDSHNYLCIRTSSGADSTSEPGTGTNWQSFWLLADDLTADEAWSDVGSYIPGTLISVPASSGNTLQSLAVLRIFKAGQIYPVELVDRMDFSALDPIERGIPTHAFFAPGPLPQIYVYPTPDQADLTLCFTAVLQPSEQSLSAQVYLHELWQPALQYGLAAELAYYYALPADRIGPLVQKAEIEFKRALGSDKGDTDSCFVKPCY
jgi:hypothetical protein